MHINSSGARDVDERGVYTDNCAYGWYYNPTFTLAQPAAPQCSGTSSGPVNLSWTSSSGALNYYVYRTSGDSWVNNLTPAALPL